MAASDLLAQVQAKQAQLAEIRAKQLDYTRSRGGTPPPQGNAFPNAAPFAPPASQASVAPAAFSEQNSAGGGAPTEVSRELREAMAAVDVIVSEMTTRLQVADGAAQGAPAFNSDVYNSRDATQRKAIRGADVTGGANPMVADFVRKTDWRGEATALRGQLEGIAKELQANPTAPAEPLRARIQAVKAELSTMASMADVGAPPGIEPMSRRVEPVLRGEAAIQDKRPSPTASYPSSTWRGGTP